MTQAVKERIRRLIRENYLVRKHNQQLIGLYLHYFEQAHHPFRKRRAEKQKKRTNVSAD